MNSIEEKCKSKGVRLTDQRKIIAQVMADSKVKYGAKDHPDVVLHRAKAWLGKSEETDKLVKHALRTLLKKGDPRALKLFGYGYTASTINSANNENVISCPGHNCFI